MIKAPLPADEDLRLQNLLMHEILDTEEDSDFTSLVELAASICGCPIAAISFIDKDRQWFKARKNIQVTETDRDISFCAHTILQDDVMMIPDASLDPRFHDSPFVTGEMKIGFYAGTTIVSNTGHNLGSLCVLDQQSKTVLSEEQIKALRIIARQISINLELKLKNKQFQKQATMLLEAERQVSLHTFTENESERSYIARQLHENFAQSLAATKLFIEFAQQSAEMSGQFLKMSSDNITGIINDIRTLAQSIVPTTLPAHNTVELLKELSHQWEEKTGTSVDFVYTNEKNAGEIDALKGLVLYRILQQQFKLSRYYHPDAIKVQLELVQQKGWNMEFAFNTRVAEKDKAEPILLVKNISSRAASANGAMVMLSNEKGITLKVSLPE